MCAHKCKMCGNLSVAALFTLLALALVTDAGFINEPCSGRNTALLNPSRPYFPAQVQCVDLTEMPAAFLEDNTKFANWPLQNASSLFADNMNLTRVPANFMRLLPRLELIDFSNNALRGIQLYVGDMLPMLRTLLMDSNKVRTPRRRPLFRSKSLLTLQLSHNKIRQIYPFTFALLPSLKTLYLDSNLIKNVDGSMFTLLHNLKFLHLGNNLIKQAPAALSLPPMLKTVLLKGNEEIDRMCEWEDYRVYPCSKYV